MLLIVAGCQPSAAKIPKAPPVAGAQAESEDATGNVPAKAKGPGDAEAEIRVELSVIPDAALPNVAVNSVKNAKGNLSICEVAVTPPCPKELWASVRLSVQGDYASQPVVLRGTLRRDGQPIEAIHTIVSGRNPLEVGGAVWPLEFKFDALKGLAPIPATMLLDVMLTAEVMAPGTDAALLDPGKPLASEALAGNLMSNPLRINFAPGGGTQ